MNKFKLQETLLNMNIVCNKLSVLYLIVKDNEYVSNYYHDVAHKAMRFLDIIKEDFLYVLDSTDNSIDFESIDDGEVILEILEKDLLEYSSFPIELY